MGEVVDAAGQSLGQPAEQRERAEGHDQRRDPPARDQEPVQASGQGPQHQASAPRPRRSAGPPSRQSLPKTTAERPISEPTERSMPPLMITGVSATRQQADLDAQAQDLEAVRQRQEIGADRPRRRRFPAPGARPGSPVRARAASRPSRVSGRSIGGTAAPSCHRPSR